MPAKDESGNRYGKVIVIERVENNHRGDAQWLCLCDCGKEFITKGVSLRSGHTRSCGCLQKEVVQQLGYNNTANLLGQKFGKLIVVERVIGDKDNIGKWFCQCDCGGTTITTTNKLTSGHSQSCGCIQSQGELKISQMLTDFNISFAKEFTFFNLKSNKNYKLRFDFAIFKDNQLQFLIEYDGIQHYNEDHFFWTEDVKNNDKLKTDYCLTNEIKLYRIRYNENTEQQILDILKKEGMK